jgi:hypothetical protein
MLYLPFLCKKNIAYCTQLMENKGLISIIYPFSNMSSQMSDSVFSIANQEYKNIEVLFLHTSEYDFSLLNKTLIKFPYLNVRQLEYEKGINPLNFGIQHAKGEFVVFLAPEFILHPSRFKEQIEGLELNTDTQIITSKVDYQSNLEDSLKYKLFYDWQNDIITYEEHLHHRFIELPFSLRASLIRKDVFEEHGFFTNNPEVPEDYDLILKWLNNGVKVLKLDKYLTTLLDSKTRTRRNHRKYLQQNIDMVVLQHMAEWISENIDRKRKLVVFGSSVRERNKYVVLKQFGLQLEGFVQLKHIEIINHQSYTLEEVLKDKRFYILVLNNLKGIRRQMRFVLEEEGLEIHKDFILGS